MLVCPEIMNMFTILIVCSCQISYLPELWPLLLTCLDCRLVDENKKIGLHFNSRKTKIMPKTWKCGLWILMKINGHYQTLLTVLFNRWCNTHKYKAKWRNNNGGDHDQKDGQSIDTMCSKSQHLKLRLFNSCMIPVLTH